jgi:hypothetical protein
VGADVACGLPIGTSLLPLGVVVLLAERALLPDFERWGREHLAVAATALAIGVGATGLLGLVSPRLGGGGHSPGQVAQGVLVLAAVASGMFVARLLLGLRRPAGRIDPTMLGKFVP